MTQHSYFHNGAMRGDSAEAPYSVEIFHDVMRKLFSSARTNGVISSLTSLTELLVSSAAVDMEVDVASGEAFIEGIYYKNSGTVSFELDGLGGGGNRWDRIVIRIDWTAQTARLAVIKGIESGSPVVPALQQEFGVIYEFPLARVFISNSLIIQAEEVFDERTIIETAQSPPTINIMHNTQFIGGAGTGHGSANEAPAYWYTEGTPTIDNLYPSFLDYSLYPSDVVLEGQALDVTLNTGDTLKTDVLISRALSTIYSSDQYATFTLAFYIYVKTGGVDFYTDFGFGATLTASFRQTSAPVLYMLRGLGYSVAPGFEMSFEGNGNFILFPITLAYGLTAAPFHPQKEALLFAEYVNLDYTRSTSSDNVVPRTCNSLEVLPVFSPRRAYPLLWQQVNDSGSAGADSIYAEIKNPPNALRTEIGRLPNDIAAHSTGLANSLIDPDYRDLNSDIVASGASTLDQSVRWIGVLT